MLRILSFFLFFFLLPFRNSSSTGHHSGGKLLFVHLGCDTCIFYCMQIAQLYWLLTKPEAKMAEYWPRSFYLLMDWGTGEIHPWTCNERSLPISSPISNLDRTSLVRKVFIMWHTGHKFLAGHSGQSKKVNIAPSCHYDSQLQCRMWFILHTCTTSRVIKFKVIPQK